jgi:hypothetical protein
MSWRKQQLNQYYNGDGIMEQDAQLIKFIKDRAVTKLCLFGEPDLEYFAERLPGVEIYNQWRKENNYMVAFIRTNPYVNFEQFLSQLSNIVKGAPPDYLYVAINKYVVVTEQEWPDLTDNYDADLLDNITKVITPTGYQEVARAYREDTGQYFNFVHPTTNIYYERTNSTDNQV